MFKTILFPTDFSDVSKKALDYIRQLKGAGTEEVIVVHVIEWHPSYENLPGELKKELQNLLEVDARKEMKIIESTLKSSGFIVTCMIEKGNPVSVILKLDGRESISAIVLGSHGKSNIKEIFIGSVSENIIRKSLKPVLIIKR